MAGDYPALFNKSGGVHIDWRNTSGKGEPGPSPRWRTCRGLSTLGNETAGSKPRDALQVQPGVPGHVLARSRRLLGAMIQATDQLPGILSQRNGDPGIIYK